LNTFNDVASNIDQALPASASAAVLRFWNTQKLVGGPLPTIPSGIPDI
jgi:hypothetical protein